MLNIPTPTPKYTRVQSVFPVLTISFNQIENQKNKRRIEITNPTRDINLSADISFNRS
jgi:hypothetical protein